jgi:tetratricopeptide (TPR) repeat protein
MIAQKKERLFYLMGYHGVMTQKHLCLLFGLFLAACAPAADLAARRARFEAAPTAENAKELAHGFTEDGAIKEGLGYFSACRKSAGKAAPCRLGEAVLLAASGNHEAALAACAEVFSVFEKRGAEADLAAALHVQGNLHWESPNPSRALEAYRRAAALREKLGDRPGTAALFSNVGGVLGMTGDFDGALSALKRAVEIYEEEGLSAETEIAYVRALGNLASVYGFLGKSTEARPLLLKNLAVAERRRDFTELPRAQLSLGILEEALSNYQASTEWFRKALGSARALGNRDYEIRALNGLSTSAGYVGDYAAQGRRLHEALAVIEETGQTKFLESVLSNLALHSFAMGDLEGAIRLERRALEMREHSDMVWGAAISLNNLGLYATRAGRLDEARSFFQKALERGRREGNAMGEAAALVNLSSLDMEKGDWESAQGRMEEAAGVCRRRGDRYSLSQVEASLARCMRGRGGAKEALAHAAEAMRLAGEIGSLERMLPARKEMARASAGLGLRDEALGHYRAALAIIEDSRAALGETSQRQGFFESRLDAYEELAEALLASPPPSPGFSPIALRRKAQRGEAEAFSVSERMKARGFLDEMGLSRMASRGLPAELLGRRGELEARIRWLKNQAAGR